MTAVIRLDHVLREATSAPYRNLVTRPTGAAVRHRVVTALRGSPRTEVVLDFSELGLVDYSCADEVVAKLLSLGDELPATRLILAGVRWNHADPIAHALCHHGLAVVAFVDDDDRPSILGTVPEDCDAAFQVMRRYARVTAQPVAESLAWDFERAAAALERLAALGCAIAHPDATYELGSAP